MNSQEYFHDAMATTFSLKITDTEPSIAEHVAGLCFQRLDDLELKLSRFVPDSDVSRINRMKSGDEIMLEEEVYQCLKKAITITSLTKGHFDVGTAELSDIYRGYQSGMLNDFEYHNAIQSALSEKSAGSLYLNPDKEMIHCINEGIKIDLGGIGKGYAIDVIRELCLENDVCNFSVDAGKSTLLVHRDRPVSFQLSARDEQQEISLIRNTVSSSGTGQQGNHIFNPVSGVNEERIYDRIWVCCDSASSSDAFATAFFTMSTNQVSVVSEIIEEIDWIAISRKGIIEYIKSNKKQLI